jgi:hypothetical protein
MAVDRQQLAAGARVGRLGLAGRIVARGELVAEQSTTSPSLAFPAVTVVAVISSLSGSTATCPS